MSGSVHLRAIVIAGALATLALALGFVTLLMNQTASTSSSHTVLPLKDRRHESTQPKHTKRVDPNFAAALAGGLPRSVARALAARPAAVVELTSQQDPVARLALGEARVGAGLGSASFVAVDVDRDGGDIARLTRLLGKLPDAPAALVYARPALLYVTLTGFNDRTIVQQAAANATVAAVAARAAQTSPAVAATWSVRANSLCRATFTEIDSLGGLGHPGKLATHKARFESVAAGFLVQLKALKPPAGKVAAVRRLNTLLAKKFAADDAIVAAAARHDAQTLASAKARAASLQPQTERLERQLGATACADATA